MSPTIPDPAGCSLDGPCDESALARARREPADEHVDSGTSQVAGPASRVGRWGTRTTECACPSGRSGRVRGSALGPSDRAGGKPWVAADGWSGEPARVRLGWRRGTSSSASTRSCATTPSSGTCASCSRTSAPSSSSTSSSATSTAGPTTATPARVDLRAGQGHPRRAGLTAPSATSTRSATSTWCTRPPRVDPPDEPPRVRIGGPDCTKPYDMALLNVSAMSFGALSANAIRALNEGAALGGFAHDTGEGGLSPLPPRERRRPRLGDRHAATSAPAPRTATSTRPCSRTRRPATRSSASRSS